MNPRLILIATAMLLSVSLQAVADEGAVAEIKSLIEKSYVHGAFNELNPEALEQGFHPDFAVFTPDGETIKKYPIAKWVKLIADRKASADYDPAANKWDHNFAAVDVTGNSASVKLELSKEGKLAYTDYLSLLKFDSGWRVVARIYHRHGD